MVRTKFRGGKLDLDLAIARTAMDMFDDWHPDVLNREGLRAIGNLSDRVHEFITHGGFLRAEQFDIPKPGYALRYGLETDLSERILYQALCDWLIVECDGLLDASILGYRLSTADSHFMFTPRVSAWARWTGVVRETLAHDGTVLLRTDVTNYFESLSIDSLCDWIPSNFRRPKRGVVESCALLRRILHSWSPFSGRGIPQNRDPSSFLGNLFLVNLDRHMAKAGFRYFRWVDDMMVVCRDRFEAQFALREIVSQLRILGLNVNAQKTKIIPATDQAQIREHLPAPDRLMEQIDELLRPGQLPPMKQAVPMLKKMLKSAAQDLDNNDRRFRFCLHRVIKLQRVKNIAFEDDDLTDMVIAQLTERPWWSDLIAQYLRLVPLKERHIDAITRLLIDKRRNLYGWQGYHLWSVLGARDHADKSQTKLARATVASSRYPAERAASAVFLGRHGTELDRQKLARRIHRVESRFVRRAFAIASQQISKEYAERYVKPNLDRSVAAMYDHLRARDGGPLYYAPLEPLDPDEVFNLLPGEGIS